MYLNRDIIINVILNITPLDDYVVNHFLRLETTASVHSSVYLRALVLGRYVIRGLSLDGEVAALLQSEVFH